MVAKYSALQCTILKNSDSYFTVTAHIERRRSIKLWDFLAPYYGRFRRKIVEKTVIFRRFFAENDQSESPGVLIKSGVLFAQIRYIILRAELR